MSRRASRVVDPVWNAVSLLLHMDGANAGTTFTDASNNGHSMSITGTVTTSTTAQKFGPTSCRVTTASRLNTPAHASFNLGTGDWTIEFWIKITRTVRVDVLQQNATYATANNAGVVLNVGASGDLSWYEQTTQRINATGTAVNDGNWHHIAVTRSGSSVRMFLDGTQSGSTYTTSFTYWNSSTGIGMGCNSGNTNGFSTDYLDDVRITKGVARYTANFAVPAAPLPGPI